MDLPSDCTNSRKRSARDAASSPSPGPSRSSTHSTPRPKEPSKRTRREDESRFDVATRQVGHTYSHGIAKDHSRVHYGDNFYNYNKIHRQSCEELGLRQDGNQSGQDAIEAALKSLAFAQMEARRETISTTYSNTCEWFFEKTRVLGLAQPSHDARSFWLLLDQKQARSRKVDTHEVSLEVC
jgi:hypothetical protein